MTDIIFKAPTPDLTLECTGTVQKGRCYTVTTYRITSRTKLPRTVFDGLRASGLLGYGQGWSVSEAVEETQTLVPTAVDSSGKTLAFGYDVVLNPYSRQPYKTTYRTVYVYTVTSECDSGD